ncbi:hypothetical protein N9Y42_11130 [Mariniblastus sp.]|nr:hypothetical protein [Mariniblastus sp.]
MLFASGLVFCEFLRHDMKAASVEGPAPNATHALRRDWANSNNLKKYFTAAEQWIREDKSIEDKIGSVVGVAPTGGPNEYCEGFGECWATMNLEVIGDKGEGVVGVTVSFDGRTGDPQFDTSKKPRHFKLFDNQN